MLGIFLALPFVSFFVGIISPIEDFSIFELMFGLILQLLIIRIFFIGLAFRYISNESLQRLKDVLDIEWTE